LGEHGAYLDRIYHCPHHPDGGYDGEVKELKIPCSCRKPSIGMIQLAQAELNADLSESWLIGDSTADILAAKVAGVRSILLQTGSAGLDEKYPVVPDYITPNLASAVGFILHDYPRLLEQCKQWISGIKSRDVILIGGLSRSGKSTLAHLLMDALQKNNIASQIISIDGWIKAPNQRGLGVLDRYNTLELNALLESLVNRQDERLIDIPIYSKRKQTSLHTFRELISPNDVLIVEGTIALDLLSAHSSESNPSIHRWNVQVDEEMRKKRVISEYLLRGKSLSEAESIYTKRQIDETPFISAVKKKATKNIDLQLDDQNSWVS
jgi:uridine kinase